MSIIRSAKIKFDSLRQWNRAIHQRDTLRKMDEKEALKTVQEMSPAEAARILKGLAPLKIASIFSKLEKQPKQGFDRYITETKKYEIPEYRAIRGEKLTEEYHPDVVSVKEESDGVVGLSRRVFRIITRQVPAYKCSYEFDASNILEILELLPLQKANAVVEHLKELGIKWIEEAKKVVERRNDETRLEKALTFHHPAWLLRRMISPIFSTGLDLDPAEHTQVLITHSFLADQELTHGDDKSPEFDLPKQLRTFNLIQSLTAGLVRSEGRPNWENRGTQGLFRHIAAGNFGTLSGGEVVRATIRELRSVLKRTPDIQAKRLFIHDPYTYQLNQWGYTGYPYFNANPNKFPPSLALDEIKGNYFRGISFSVEIETGTNKSVYNFITT